jgi:dipeptidyl aminopeptidase/acylaminoacyl peptidase
MFFHGNAEIADYLGPIVAGYGELGVHVLLMEYRGYGRSDGKPGQGVILEDAMFFHDLLASRPEVDRGRVFVHGRSLGGGAAADLARHRRPRAMVLESTFDSLAGHVSRLGLPAFLLRHPFRTDRVVAQADYPLLILHGVRDEVVPVSQGRRLNEAARERGVEVRYIEWDAGHNDFPPEEREAEYWAEIRALLVRAGVL